jgi:hypothetical protein
MENAVTNHQSLHLFSFSNKGGLLALASSTTGLVSHKAQKWSKS